MSLPTFPALIIHQPVSEENPAVLTQLRAPAELPNTATGATLRVLYSSLNYKDALAVTGKGNVLRKFPIVPGIDLAGIVESTTEDKQALLGKRVIATGYGLGESVSGGYAGYAVVSPEWLLPLPAGLNEAQCMALGTAGFTAALSLLAIEAQGLSTDAGQVLVTGATGGVGSIAIHLLAQSGYEVVASSARIESEAAYLTELGAATLIHRDELTECSDTPLQRERWAAAIDSVGGATLATVLGQIQKGGAVASVGLAGGHELSTTVFPFILRGVSLLGIDSVMCPMENRLAAWELLAERAQPETLDQITRLIPLEAVPATALDLLSGKTRGRISVDIGCVGH